MIESAVEAAVSPVVPSSRTERKTLTMFAARDDPDGLTAILSGPLPASLSEAYRSRHPLISWVTRAYPSSGDAWERQLGYAFGHAAAVRTGELTQERFMRALDAIARDPTGRRHGRRPPRVVPVDAAAMEHASDPPPITTATSSLGPELVAYVSTAVGWRLPPVIEQVLEESTDLLVDLACRVSETRSRPFDMRVLVDRTTWGRLRASTVLGHLPDRARRSVAHIVCGHPKIANSSAIHLMSTVPDEEIPLDVIAAWRGDLPGLHPEMQEVYRRGQIDRARLGIPPAETEITPQRPSSIAI
jgi:hypothetical protein